MSDKKRRVKKLEKQAGKDDKPVIIVDWSTDARPPKPGQIIITWDDEDDG